MGHRITVSIDIGVENAATEAGWRLEEQLDLDELDRLGIEVYPDEMAVLRLATSRVDLGDEMGLMLAISEDGKAVNRVRIFRYVQRDADDIGYDALEWDSTQSCASLVEAIPSPYWAQQLFRVVESMNLNCWMDAD